MAAWRARSTPEGKLRFEGVQLGGDYQRDPTTGEVTHINAARVGLVLPTSAPFQLSFVVEAFHTSFEGEFPPHRPLDDRGGSVTPGEIKVYRDNAPSVWSPST